MFWHCSLNLECFGCLPTFETHPLASGLSLTEGYGTRTHKLRIDSPPTSNANALVNQANPESADLGLLSACPSEINATSLINLLAQIAALPPELRMIIAKLIAR